MIRYIFLQLFPDKKLSHFTATVPAEEDLFQSICDKFKIKINIYTSRNRHKLDIKGPVFSYYPSCQMSDTIPELDLLYLHDYGSYAVITSYEGLLKFFCVLNVSISFSRAALEIDTNASA